MIIVSLVVSVLGCVAVGIALALGKRVPVVLGALPAALPALVAFGSLVWSSGNAVQTADAVPAMYWQEAYGAALMHGFAEVAWVGWIGFWGIVALLVGAVVGSVKGGKLSYWMLLPCVGVTLLLLGSVGLTYFMSLSGHAVTPTYLVRVPMYLAVCVLGSVAMLCGDQERAGPESAGIAGIAVLFAVIGVELGDHGANVGMVYDAFSQASHETRTTLWTSGMAMVGLPYGRGLVIATWASAFALLGIGVASTPTGVRRVGAVSGLIWPVLAFVALLGADPTDDHLAQQRRVHDRMFPAPSDLLLLPQTTSQRLPVFGPSVQVSKEGVRIDGFHTADLESALIARLKKAKDFEASTQRKEQQHRALFLADGRLPFGEVRPVLESVRAAGYELELIGQYGGPRMLAAGVRHTAPVQVFVNGPQIGLWKDGIWTDELHRDRLPELLTRLAGKGADQPLVLVAPTKETSWQDVMAVLDLTNDWRASFTEIGTPFETPGLADSTWARPLQPVVGAETGPHSPQ
jgi:biopolymer transport protein ExbD